MEQAPFVKSKYLCTGCFKISETITSCIIELKAMKSRGICVEKLHVLPVIVRCSHHVLRTKRLSDIEILPNCDVALLYQLRLSHLRLGLISLSRTVGTGCV